METLVSTKVKDYLETDEPIRGQAFACISFICPEKVLNDKTTFMFNKFLSSIAPDVAGMFDNLVKRFPEAAGFIDNVRTSHDYLSDGEALQERFRAYMGINSGELEDEFHKLNDFRTTVRGVKIRGAYGSLDEAKARAEKLKIRDGDHNIWVGEVGAWLPFADNPDELENQEYAESALNTLMKSYKENIDKKDAHFAERSREMREKINAEA
jgi:hypothetical protein